MSDANRLPRATSRLYVSIVAIFLVAAALPSWGSQAHPRRTEVMNRDRHLSNQMNRDYGHLTGHYNQLQHQDAAVRRQTQSDMQKNGGHLTRADQRHLNGEENTLRSEVAADKGAPPKGTGGRP